MGRQDRFNGATGGKIHDTDRRRKPPALAGGGATLVWSNAHRGGPMPGKALSHKTASAVAVGESRVAMTAEGCRAGTA